MEKDPKRWKIQLRYADGVVVNFITQNPPVTEFILKGHAFRVFLTLIKCGEEIEIKKVFYKEIGNNPPLKSA